MKLGLAVLGLVLVTVAPVRAGELIFANGSRLDGELVNETLLISTGSGLVEIGPDEVVTLTREEIRLRDGRVIRGTLVGGRLKARTALGEIAVKVDELDVYRGPATAAPAPASGPAASAAAAGSGVAVATASGPEPGRPAGVAGAAGLPAVTSYQEAGARPAVTPASLPAAHPATLRGRRLEVLGEGALYSEALSGSAQVGHVIRGQHVTYVDSIDRRLRILNHLVFDGGHWVKVRLADGTEGWIPADSVRELR
jgi:hypothetical protein